MIQNFDITGGPDLGRANLPALRKALSAQMLDGFIIPHEDEYQNEYLPDCNERLMWATGFTGSAGAAIVLSKTAAVFVDGRYTLQVKDQVASDLFSYERLERSGPAKWLEANLTSDLRIGYDPRLITPASLKPLITAAESAKAELVAVTDNPIDKAWADRPAPPCTPVQIMPLKIAGMNSEDKRLQIAQLISEKGADAALITSPASIAWLFNIRGADVMCTPLTLSTAVIYNDGRAELYINPKKLTGAIKKHLGPRVAIKDETALTEGLAGLSGDLVIADPSSCSAFMFDALTQAKANILRSADPVLLPKAQKNAAEIAGTEAAHIRDGAALTKFLHWLATAAQSGDYDEIQAAQTLEEFRAEDSGLKDLSFESISGAGSNGAVVHYRVNAATNLKLARGTLYLIDSGGQYIDGTTDVTRTVAIGTPSDEMRSRYTLVLKGHIALAKIRFPAGTTGHALDALARMALWQQGLDYDHGTGHGVGVYLGVHEGPQRISKSHAPTALLPGMIVSNEPGYYKTGEYGIRIENLQYVHPASAIKGGERDMLGFTTLTYAPLDKALIDTDLLSAEEISWLNGYHADVWNKISPLVDGEVKTWLKDACAPL